MAKNSISTFLCTLGKYCTHLMSGLGSGMPKSVTLVTQVTVNFWAHVRYSEMGKTAGLMMRMLASYFSMGR